MPRGTAMLRRVLAVTVLVGSLLLIGVSGASAASTPLPKPSAPANQMTPVQWATLEASLNQQPGLTKTISVSGNTRTFTYTNKTGESIVLKEPVGAAAIALGVTPNFALEGCGWFQECVLLTNQDLTVISAGGGYLIILAMCTFGPGTCALGGALVTFVVAYIAVFGICSHDLKVELVPLFAAPWNLACW